MKKKKVCVLHAQVPFVRGGAELMVESLMKNLRERNYDVELIQLPYKWYPENSLYDNLLMWRCLDLKEVNGEKIDLVISTKFPSYGVQHDNKVVWLMHQYRQAYDLYDSEYGLRHTENGNRIQQTVKRYDNECLTEAKKIYSISDNVGNRLKKYNNMEAETLYHPPSLVGRYECESYNKTILSVGRLDKLKRNDLLIKSLKYTNKDIKAIIAGKGPEMENLKKLARSLGVEKRVHFAGFVTDEELIKLYAQAGAVYFAPVDEDYGYITLEAFLSKKPVITCKDSGGVLEFIEDEVSGYVCQTKEESIGAAIQKVCSSSKKSAEMGQIGYERVKDISWDNVIDSLTSTLR